MTSKAAWIVASAIMLAVALYVYFSPYNQCVAEGETPARANGNCSILQFRR